MTRAVAVLCVRDEGAFLLDWMAHHLAVGFTHVVACSNACSDGTDALLDRLAQLGHVTHLRNPGPYHKAGIQFTALKSAGQSEAVRAADWLLALDIDEFVTVRTGGHRLEDLWRTLPDADAITLTWRLFGNSGVVHWQDRPVWEVFRRAAPEVLYWPWRAAMFKTLYRNDGTYRALGVHRPRQPRHARLHAYNWYDGHGRPLDALYKTGRLFSPCGQPNTGLVQLSHFALGSMESYILKAARGRAVHADQPLGLDYWVERNFSSVEDLGMARLDGPRAEIRDRFARDPELADLHAAAVAWRKNRFADLMREDRYRDLMGRLRMTRPTRPLSAREAGEMLRQAPQQVA